ncbi:molybdopterin-dependent oxidoreductase [Arhodomonas sp. AD133]|uniref:molybdopterin-dependent oxidoreductase n=1 Tax=Arhodomonas sp. AD133 TaxID=3415009 RepID=UPI003EC08FDC
MSRGYHTMTHWGAYRIEVADGRVQAVHPWSEDPDPSAIGAVLAESQGPERVTRPMIRRGWLEGRSTAECPRGGDEFVAVDWDDALGRVAGELQRVRERHGNEAIYGGSYGWASAGRFHHAQSQIHRFLAAIGGYVRSVNSYSLAAAEVITPYVVGYSYDEIQAAATSLDVVAGHTEQLVCFGGVPWKNAQVQSGGQGRHVVAGHLRRAAERGCRLINLSPLRADLETPGAEWWPVRANTDLAIMLGIAHTLVAEGRHDEAFIERYTSGFEPFRAELMGESEAPARDAEWAAGVSGVPAEAIRRLARDMAGHRTLINVSWSLQRADHGEQVYWMAMVLAALLGQIGLPGGGFALGYGAVGSVGNGAHRVKLPALPRLPNPVRAFIPVARIADMLLHPGATFDYDGGRYTYPDIRLVYWAGGNPFHHHQDLNRLVRAWQCPETVIVHEPFWTGTAQHADIVLPATTPLERNDFGGSSQDDTLIAMQQALPPVGEARNDYDIFTALAERLGERERFSHSRSEGEWLRALYEQLRERQPVLPDFDTFWQRGWWRFGADEPPVARVLLAGFRADPQEAALPTPSGRLEIHSPRIEAMGLPDCPAHPTWQPPAEWCGADEAGRWPLHLLSHQPATRLHSQYNHAGPSRQARIAGAEPILIHPDDARPRAIADGDRVRVANDRGACLAGARVTDAVMPGVVVMPTGAPFLPQTPGRPGALELAGNPNVLTRDRGTSRLAQGPTAQTCLVDVRPAADYADTDTGSRSGARTSA